MDIYIDRLKKRAKILGNHYQKYITIVDKYIDALMGRLENAGMIERVHLWATAHDYREEMSTIAGVSDAREQRLDDLGCYFAYQFLQLNLGALDALMYEVTTKGSKQDVYKQFMLRVGHDFRRLTAAYMEQLLKQFLATNELKSFVVLGVGTRSDQDDIDIGVVDRGEEDREELNKAIGRMSMEMFKKAISLHLHLSEHVGKASLYLASIEEYDELLQKEIHDFVIITEMLGAARILGSRKLFSDFRRQVTFRYYHNPRDSKNTKFHEGYLRGIVGETRSLMFRELYNDRINPKLDGLRMIKSGLYAAKTIFNLRQVNAWAILEELQHHDKRRGYFYRELEASLTFLEIFRYLFQLLTAQEEDIFVNDQITYDNLSLMAEAMGYTQYGTGGAVDFLLTDYFKYIRNAKETVRNVLPYIVDHLSSITVFGRMARHKKVTEDGKKRVGNWAVQFLQESKFFRGTRFWDDIADVFERKNGYVLKRLVNDLYAMNPERRRLILNGFIEWGWNSFIATFSLILLLYKFKDEIADPHLYEEYNKLFLERARATPEVAQRLSIVFKSMPELLYEYLQTLSTEQQKSFYEWLSAKPWDDEIEPDRHRLRLLTRLHYGTSTYFKRIMSRVLGDHPEYLSYLDDSRRLALIGRGILAGVERAQNNRQKLVLIHHYHSFEFFRVCLNTLTGLPAPVTADDFTVFSDTYIRLLFEISKEFVDETLDKELQTKDLLGVFVTGGHGQMLAFDDDYDLIILLNSDDHEILQYSTAIMRKMHREIVKCGIMPHYRFSDHTVSFVCTFSQLKKILAAPSRDKFIDMSQLLATRMIVGSSVLQNTFDSEIIHPFIFARQKQYIVQMINELKSRERDFKKDEDDHLDIKDTPGGVRDIELLLFIFKSLFKIRENSNYVVLQKLQTLLPAMKADFKKLFESYQLLRLVRNLNRIIVSADDTINIDYLHDLADNLEIEPHPHKSRSLVLFNDLKKTIRQSRGILKKAINKIEKEYLRELPEQE
ncbi:hypothetical protein A2V82_03420 [candidate division KSB1 bacterium RBG_16_48_16]|nr:MAG: hypothetical protein A2V82_03420 [candidate division KSB1 bacterium RBG_16_48_16]